MRSHNMVTLTGNIASAPEMHETKNGKKLCSFAIAVTRSWPENPGENQREADFHKVVAWGSLAEICDKYLQKGLRVFLQGKLVTRSYELNDEKKYVTEIHAEELEIITKKKDVQNKELTTK